MQNRQGGGGLAPGFLALLFLAAGFFAAKSPAADGFGGPVISEIMTGSPGALRREFVELYNPHDYDLDLSGYRLAKRTKSGAESNLAAASKFAGVIRAKGYFVIAHPDHAAELGADLAYSGASYSIADDNAVVLYAPDSSVADLAGWGKAGDYEGEPAPNPAPGQSLERFGADSGNNRLDFRANPTPGPGAPPAEEAASGSEGNGPEPPPAPTPVPAPTPTPVPAPKAYRFGAVVINELVSDPADNDTEWVELYNTLDEEIDLEGWKIVEGGGQATVLKAKIAPRAFLAVADLKGSLNNRGDLVELRDRQGVLADSVAYGDWDDGRTADNAPAAADPYSIARRLDGNSSRNNREDFALTAVPTKGGPNIIAEPEEERAEDADSGADGPESAAYGGAAEIYIAEILPNPPGPDDGEFIELYNHGAQAVSLDGWRLGDASQKRYRLSGTIGAGAYLAVWRSDSKIALNNGADSVGLYPPLSDRPSREISYEQAEEGRGLNCANFENGELALECVWSDAVTPGAANRLAKTNHPPQADFDCPETVLAGAPARFDSSDTIDEDGDELAYSWDFGDGSANTLPNPEHTYLVAGEYRVSLTVSDKELSAQAQRDILVLDPDRSGAEGEARLVISEFLPDPAGADGEGEWIELYNSGQTRVSLLNWQLDDTEGGSRPYRIKDRHFLDPGGYFLFDREETGLALNNPGDSVRLFDPAGRLADAADYRSAREGEAFARDSAGKWHWTLEPTPGEANVIRAASVTANAPKRAAAGSGPKAKPVLDAPLDKARDLEKGDLVRTSGTVAVLPGVFGSQYFYITGSSGLQVYNHKKDFPDLRVGDRVAVRGEISEAYGEKRLKTASAADIEILERASPPEAAPLDCADISEERTGELVRISGEVTERKGSSLYLDDGTDERLVYFKQGAGLNPSQYKSGDRLAVAGIVAMSTGGPRLQPRGSGDLVRLDGEEGQGLVLGEATTAAEWALPPADRRRELYLHLLIIASAAIAVLGISVFRLSRK